jgi:hypothetical protein
MENLPNNIILPSKYLSWSQMTCWLKSPARYRQEYFEHGEKLDTRFLRFGKGVAELIESGKQKELLPDLIVYDIREHKIQTTVNGVPILSYLDDYDPIENVFREKKTGKIPWTQAKVQKHDQLVFYATALKWSIGKIPAYCDLDYIETREGAIEREDFWRSSDKIIQTTGRVVSFHREFYDSEIERMENLIVKVATEISEAYKEYIKEI